MWSSLYYGLLILFCGIPLITYGFPTVVIILAGFWPTILAFMLDDTIYFHLTACVGYLNFSGILAMIAVLWIRGQTLEMSLKILSLPQTWMVMYGAGCLGFIIYVLVPSVLAVILEVNARLRIKQLSAQQEKLASIWGDGVRKKEKPKT